MRQHQRAPNAASSKEHPTRTRMLQERPTLRPKTAKTREFKFLSWEEDPSRHVSLSFLFFSFHFISKLFTFRHIYGPETPIHLGPERRSLVWCHALPRVPEDGDGEPDHVEDGLGSLARRLAQDPDTDGGARSEDYYDKISFGRASVASNRSAK